MPSPGLWRHVDLMWTDVSDERTASIFSVEKSASDVPAWASVCRLKPPAHAGSSFADFSTLKMEAIRSSETSVHTRLKWRHIPEDGILHSHCRENLKSYIIFYVIEPCKLTEIVSKQKELRMYTTAHSRANVFFLPGKIRLLGSDKSCQFSPWN
jgi:hypothetical protein